ncbi:imelysin family protein [Sulfurimonas sp. HSL3-7]|uniref:imelysin family protein n=1 Tax=Sulfonitrofixus jiaomeiensis TaxID=3131938 RepID=UPI0031FA31F3
MKVHTKIGSMLSLAAVLVLSGCGSDSSDKSETSISTAQKKTVLTTYADIAETNYNDALSDAQAMQIAITAFAAAPDETTLAAAKAAWLTARESYGTTEAFRLSEGPIDAEEGFATIYGAPEGQINAWPLDENMIDYTQTNSSSEPTSGNIIDTADLFTPNGGSAVDVTTITTSALAELNENGGDANVATGYHAVEFLLWGQDQDYENFLNDTITNGALRAGERPLEDFDGTNANSDRRLEYLQAAADLIVEDLSTVAAAWDHSKPADCTVLPATGCYRAAFLGELDLNATLAGNFENIAPDTALKTVISGLGVFIKSEVANERIAVAVLTPSEEDEHSCFSDNTHRDIVLNYQGFVNILKGEYRGVSKGTSMYSLLDTTGKSAVDTLISDISEKVAAIDSAARTSEHFDYQIKDGSAYKQNIIDTKNKMRKLGDEMVNVAEAFDISLSEDDVTDAEETEI